MPIRTESALPASGLTLVRYFTGIVFAYLPNTFFRNLNVVDFPLSPKGPAPHSASVSGCSSASEMNLPTPEDPTCMDEYSLEQAPI